jgi:glucan-binding YG repeat protein
LDKFYGGGPMKKSKKILPLLLVYLFMISIIPSALISQVVQASESFKTVTTKSEYYVTEAAQYKNKTFIVGRGGLNNTNLYAPQNLSVTENGVTKELVPGEYDGELFESLTKIYYLPSTWVNDSGNVFIVDKETNKVDSKTYEQFFTTFINAANKKGIRFYVSTLYFTKDSLDWVYIEQGYKDQLDYYISKNGAVISVPAFDYKSVKVDKNGNLYFYNSDSKGVTKIDLNGVQTNYALPQGIPDDRYMDITLIDDNLNLYLRSYDYYTDNGTIYVLGQNNTGLNLKKSISFKGMLNITKLTADNKVAYIKSSDDYKTSTIGLLDSSFNMVDKYTTDFYTTLRGYNTTNLIALNMVDNKYGIITSPVGWTNQNGKWYFYDLSTGEKRIGWLKDGSSWYYMDSTGAMKTGWVSIGGKWYYLNSNGTMKTGWLSYQNKWYYLDGSGVMKTGWASIGNKWYYFDSAGTMKTGWIQLGSNWYYLHSDGHMAANETVGGYYLNKDGVWVR